MDFLKDLAGVGKHLFLIFRRRRKIDFTETIFGSALGRVYPLNDCIHFIVGDVDEWTNITAKQAVPSQFCFDLPLQRRDRRTARRKIFFGFRNRATEILFGDTVEILINLILADLDFVRSRFLNLQRFVDQVGKDLDAETRYFLGRQLAVIGDQDQRQSLIDIGARNDFAVHNGCRAADIGIIRFCQQLAAAGNVERRGGKRFVCNRLAACRR